MVLGVLGRGADSAVLIVYLRVVLLPQALFLPRFDPCATSTAVPRLLGRVAGLQEQSCCTRARRGKGLKVVVHRSCRRKREQCDAHA